MILAYKATYRHGSWQQWHERWTLEVNVETPRGPKRVVATSGQFSDAMLRLRSSVRGWVGDGPLELLLGDADLDGKTWGCPVDTREKRDGSPWLARRMPRAGEGFCWGVSQHG